MIKYRELGVGYLKNVLNDFDTIFDHLDLIFGHCGPPKKTLSLKIILKFTCIANISINVDKL